MAGKASAVLPRRRLTALEHPVPRIAKRVAEGVAFLFVFFEGLMPRHRRSGRPRGTYERGRFTPPAGGLQALPDLGKFGC